MKHRSPLFLLFLFLTAILSSSCSTDRIDEVVNHEQEIQKLFVTFEDVKLMIDEANTRTQLDYSESSGSFKFSWTAGDILGVFPNEGSQALFPIADEYVGRNSALFDGGGWALKTGYSYSLYCPYDYMNMDKTSIPLNYLNQKQMAKNDYSHLNNYNYFSSKQSIVATGPDLNFKVGYVGTIFWFKFTLPEAGTFTKLRVISESIPFIRKGFLDISGETPVVTPVDESNTLTLKLNNITASKGELVDFYLWVLPKSFSGSMIKVELVTDDMKVYSVDISSTLVLEGGTCRQFNRGGAGQKQFNEEVGTEPESIVFEDEEVERICLENWDTNKDDVLDANEAAAVTDLNKAFFGTSIRSFKELLYFTGLQEIKQDDFKDCYNLFSIIVPENVKIIREGAFHCCRYLYELTLPEGLERIEVRAFERCDNLGAIDIPDNVKYIGEGAFYACNNSAWVDLPSELEEIGDRAFGWTNSFGWVDFSESEKLVKIGEEAFYACTSLQEVIFPKSLTTVGQRAFDHCFNLRKIVIPNNDGIISIGADGFGNSDCPIFVPSALLADYKDAYPEYENRFSSLEAQEGGTVISNPDMQGGW